MYVLQTSFTPAASNLHVRYPQLTHTVSSSFPVDELQSTATCHAGDDVYFRPDAAMLTQQMSSIGGGSEETGADLEASLEGIAASTALFESLAGSAVMLDLYDVFANPSAFPFPPEVDHVTAAPTTSSSATPMDMDVLPVTEYGFAAAITCQPEMFTSSTGTCSLGPGNHLTSSGSGQTLEMKFDAESPTRRLAQRSNHATSQQDMDVMDFCTANGRDDKLITSADFRYNFSEVVRLTVVEINTKY